MTDQTERWEFGVHRAWGTGDYGLVTDGPRSTVLRTYLPHGHLQMLYVLSLASWLSPSHIEFDGERSPGNYKHRVLWVLVSR